VAHKDVLSQADILIAIKLTGGACGQPRSYAPADRRRVVRRTARALFFGSRCGHDARHTRSAGATLFVGYGGRKEFFDA
jgi:hypothetical protein